MSAEGTPPSRVPSPRVTARDVLHALSEIRRRKHWPLFQELEKSEPDLTEFALEEIAAIHHTLLETRARPKTVRRLQRQVQTLVLVCVLAPRGSNPAGDDAPPASAPDRDN